jgi:SNF2 family DNA or RNA helicase
MPPFCILAELGSVEEGTVEYAERVRCLERLLGGFTLARSRSRHPLLERQLPPLTEVPIYLSLTRRQRHLYDDYLAEPANKVRTESVARIRNFLMPLDYGSRSGSYSFPLVAFKLLTKISLVCSKVIC